MSSNGHSAPIHGLTSEEVDALRKEVGKAKCQAYCTAKTQLPAKFSADDDYQGPYSKFPVGCTILVHADTAIAAQIGCTIVSGANVENAAYPNGACAERNAINTAVFLGLRYGDTRAIFVTTNMKEMCSPCGNCRQVIREFCGPDTPIFMCNVEGQYMVKTLEELLPMSFGPESLGGNAAVE